MVRSWLHFLSFPLRTPFFDFVIALHINISYIMEAGQSANPQDLFCRNWPLVSSSACLCVGLRE